jgi:hypothetical protein
MTAPARIPGLFDGEISYSLGANLAPISAIASPWPNYNERVTDRQLVLSIFSFCPFLGEPVPAQLFCSVGKV